MADSSETTQISRRHAADEPAPDLVAAVRELSARVGGLQTEVQALRARAGPLPEGAEPAGWDDPSATAADRLTWISALDAPAARAPAVPRLLLEIVFLVAVAVAAAVADLDPVEIGVVMSVAWLIVALSEWTAAQGARRRAEAVYAPLPGLSSGFPSDPSWFAPPVERARPDVVAAAEDAPKLPPPDED